MTATDYEKMNMWIDTDLTAAIKDALRLLKPYERTIFLTYVEKGSYAATARKFKVSTPTARTYILQIKEKIKNYLNDLDIEFDMD